MSQIKKYVQFNCACISAEERDKIKLLTSQLKESGDERVAETIIKALTTLKQVKRYE